jgi:hypothetical protein
VKPVDTADLQLLRAVNAQLALTLSQVLMLALLVPLVLIKLQQGRVYVTRAIQGSLVLMVLAFARRVHAVRTQIPLALHPAALAQWAPSPLLLGKFCATSVPQTPMLRAVVTQCAVIAVLAQSLVWLLSHALPALQESMQALACVRLATSASIVQLARRRVPIVALDLTLRRVLYHACPVVQGPTRALQAWANVYLVQLVHTVPWGPLYALLALLAPYQEEAPHRA